jgi:hypothetical protein
MDRSSEAVQLPRTDIRSFQASVPCEGIGAFSFVGIGTHQRRASEVKGSITTFDHPLCDPLDSQSSKSIANAAVRMHIHPPE